MKMRTRSGFSQLPSILFDPLRSPSIPFDPLRSPSIPFDPLRSPSIVIPGGPRGRFARDQESVKSRNEDLAYLKRRVVYVQTWAWDKDKVRWNRDNSVFFT